MRNHEPDEPGNVVDFTVPDDEIDFEITNLPGPQEFEDLHGYSIDEELVSGSRMSTSGQNRRRSVSVGSASRGSVS